MGQIAKGHTYGTSSPDNQVTHENLNLLADGATLLPGAITEQTPETTTAVTDKVILWKDPGDGGAGALKSVTLANLLPAGGIEVVKLSPAARFSSSTHAAGTFDTNVYTVTLDPVPAALISGMVVSFTASAANTGAVSIKVNELAAKALAQGGTRGLVAGQITAGAIVTAIYDGTRFQLVSVTPASFTSEKLLMADGVPVLTVAHGLGVVPRKVRWVLVCEETEANWAVGTEVDIVAVDRTYVVQNQYWPNFAGAADTTTAYLTIYGETQLKIKTPVGDRADFTRSKWRARVYCEA